MTVKELIVMLLDEQMAAEVHIEARSTPTYPRGSQVTGVDTEWDGRKFTVIITDFKE